MALVTARGIPYDLGAPPLCGAPHLPLPLLLRETCHGLPCSLALRNSWRAGPQGLLISCSSKSLSLKRPLLEQLISRPCGLAFLVFWLWAIAGLASLSPPAPVISRAGGGERICACLGCQIQNGHHTILCYCHMTRLSKQHGSQNSSPLFSWPCFCTGKWLGMGIGLGRWEGPETPGVGVPTPQGGRIPTPWDCSVHLPGKNPFRSGIPFQPYLLLSKHMHFLQPCFSIQILNL